MSVILPGLLLLLGILLSALFSGAETGFYRVTRVRLVIDAVDGDWVSWSLLQLTNHPTWFVATTLVGNNMANYLASLGIVMLAQQWLRVPTEGWELAATVLFTPLVFVYGELLPKSLFFQAPNTLLRRSAPWYLFFSVLFAPISAVLAMLGRLLQTMVGETPLRVRPELARKELQEVLREGQEAGVLCAPQLRTARNVCDIGGKAASRFCRPAGQVLAVPRGTRREHVVRRAHKLQEPLIIVTDPASGQAIGYLRLVELQLSDAAVVDRYRPLVSLHPQTSLIQALLQMREVKEEVGQVVDESSRVWGLVYGSDAIELLVRNRSARFAAALRYSNAIGSTVTKGGPR